MNPLSPEASQIERDPAGGPSESCGPCVCSGFTLSVSTEPTETNCENSSNLSVFLLLFDSEAPQCVRNINISVSREPGRQKWQH